AGASALRAPVPVVTSDNVSLVGHLPESGAISLEWATTGHFAYVSTTDTISVLDVSDPRAPKVTGTLVNAMFENEAMTYGERRAADGSLTRFVLAGIDLYQASPGQIERRNVLGNEFLVVDVTDPAKPFIRSRAKTKTSTHTVQCLDQAQCDVAYTAGTSGKFSVLDLRDLDAPKEVAVVGSPAAGDGGPHSVFSGGFGAGHYWDFENGLGWHTGSGGATVFDVTDPLSPTPVNGTDAQGRSPGWNDFILHNSMRPNGDVFVPGAEPSVFNGNVLLATEEDYANEGDELLCSETGSTQTWHVPDLDAAGYAARGGDVHAGTIAPLDRKTPDQFGGGLTLPAAAFCSAHWFDYHQDGFVAQGFYQAGLRILDVKNASNITQVGYATTGATEVFDAYWVPVRDENGVVTGEKTNIVYTTDLTRGIDVYEVALPELTAEQAAAKAAMEQRRSAAADSAGTPVTGAERAALAKGLRGRPAGR
ncbi:MAG TPA: hypothetical protein VNU26_12890, partial [Mycobacteriales bacterium]|nr:hypothetical protein [Mycobacteriales bacterium]